MSKLQLECTEECNSGVSRQIWKMWLYW